MPRYYDIHTHGQAAAGADTLSIRNRHGHFADPAAGYCSMGLHPWYPERAEQLLAELGVYAARNSVLAIGECGLDKTVSAPPAEQERWFTAQIRLANELGKPLILHCVRAFSEVQRLLRANRVQVPVIFHGFRKGHTLAEALLADGYYLSFGAALLHANTGLAETLARVPADRFFLETDDSPFRVSEIYAAAAAIRKIPEDAVILQLQHNFKTVFQL